MKKKDKKIFSVEQLARMTSRGFAAVDERFSAVDEQFTALRRETATKADIQGMKTDLRESEERLLNAITNVEVAQARF